MFTIWTKVKCFQSEKRLRLFSRNKSLLLEGHMPSAEILFWKTTFLKTNVTKCQSSGLWGTFIFKNVVFQKWIFAEGRTLRRLVLFIVEKIYILDRKVIILCQEVNFGSYFNINVHPSQKGLKTNFWEMGLRRLDT